MLSIFQKKLSRWEYLKDKNFHATNFCYWQVKISKFRVSNFSDWVAYCEFIFDASKFKR